MLGGCDHPVWVPVLGLLSDFTGRQAGQSFKSFTTLLDHYHLQDLQSGHSLGASLYPR